MKTRNIPIQNIYYMLCYAWNRGIEKDNIDLNGVKGNNIYDLLTLVLCKSISKIIKKGIYKEYTNHNEETYSLKGKINFSDSLKRNSFNNGRAICEFDDFSDDIEHNQIIKATLYIILKSKNIDKNLKEDVMRIYHYFSNITNINISRHHFEKAKIHRNNRYYKLPLDICKLIYNDIIADENDGSISFNYKEEEKISYIFEDFVRSFYNIHLSDSKVYREDIKWDVKIDDSFLPKMQTDITIKTPSKVIIMDTKYYKNTLASNMKSEKYHSSNMYQIFSYLKNAEAKGEKYLNSTGILLYPKVDKDLNNIYEIQGHILKICTINLNDEWINIHNRLLEIVN
ncbi:5-methylcytosine-specific restriction endonuclease system specificity protein McrC [Romboutsia lituseburensis]|uniref:5-methylcytosine-specific restriction endonuclease system specificity protein McrC n=1 Tax=Romboutsia lituseburensis TaxID=1537 RepID=UPI00215A717B|nr:5-methylcytosine-specific restriction endonuclease system specificity protein McrC [Romboutsia lituseburensis]MCR8743908.1 5-methylcytosine-specific restriction endonuclease system specificity protein McrC [Romboutsia lituseburensis]